MFFNYGPGALLGNDTSLYDLAADPGQNSLPKNSAHELRLEAPMIRLMAATEAPLEAFVRLDPSGVKTSQARLCHFNLGCPAIAPGSIVHLGSKKLLELTVLPDASDEPEPITVSTPGGADHGLTVAFIYRTDTLPYLQIWHDFRTHAGVLGVEPCTRAKTGGVEQIMQPAQIRRYELSVFNSGQ